MKPMDQRMQSPHSFEPAKSIRSVFVFFSRTLNKHELKYSSIEKQAAAIVEAVRKGSHFSPVDILVL